MILGFINACYMLLDGIYVIIKGKYIGPEKPGPWSFLFDKLGVNVFNLGPLFIIYGLLWFAWLFGLLTNQYWTYMFGIIISISTLWYLPVGTLFSVIILMILLFAKGKLGF